jgi:hypothetical protein
MGSDERYVSPYLLRPLRTLEEVLGGRGSDLETPPDAVEATATCSDHNAQLRTALLNDRPALRRTTG